MRFLAHLPYRHLLREWSSRTASTTKVRRKGRKWPILDRNVTCWLLDASRQAIEPLWQAAAIISALLGRCEKNLANERNCGQDYALRLGDVGRAQDKTS